MRLDQGQDTGSKFLSLAGRPFVFVMRELLPDFDRKLEIIRRAFGPALSRFGITWPVKRGIDLDDVEVPRIELQFVRFQEGIKQAGP